MQSLTNLSSFQQQTVIRGLLTPISQKPTSDFRVEDQQPTEAEASSERFKRASPGQKPDDVDKQTKKKYDKQEIKSRTNPIFSYLDDVMVSGSDAINEIVLGNHLLEIEHFILHQTPLSDRKAYSNCPESSRTSVHAILETEGEEPSKSSDSQRAYEDCVDIFNAADSIFGFFFQPRAEVATVNKYWGALKVFVAVSVQAVPYVIRNTILCLSHCM